MKTKFDAITGEKTWLVTTFLQKTFYVVGVAMTFYLGACFLFGVFAVIASF